MARRINKQLITDENIMTALQDRECSKCKSELTPENVSICKLRQYRYICKKCLCEETSGYVKNKNVGDVDIYLQDKKCKVCNIQLNIENIDKYMVLKQCKNICRDCHYEQMSIARKKLKQETIDEYGGCCSCCGIKNQVFLTIDHIDNSGSAHRKELSKGDDKTVRNITGHKFYTWLKKEGYQKGNYQVLCFNCNWAKHILGKCPCQDK